MLQSSNLSLEFKLWCILNPCMYNKSISNHVSYPEIHIVLQVTLLQKTLLTYNVLRKSGFQSFLRTIGSNCSEMNDFQMVNFYCQIFLTVLRPPKVESQKSYNVVFFLNNQTLHVKELVCQYTWN